MVLFKFCYHIETMSMDTKTNKSYVYECHELKCQNCSENHTPK